MPRLLLFVMLLPVFAAAQKLPSKSDLPHGEPKTISGLVRDIACPIQNKESTATTFSMECALECAKRGSPLAILTDNGTFYVPISNEMPDVSQRDKLMPFLGKYVTAAGEVYERGGLHAIVLSTIREDTHKHVKSNAFQK